MTAAGTNLGTYSLAGIPMPSDCEDIALGPGPVNDTWYLYLGDIGDNGASRSNIKVYRVPEPVVSDTQSPVTTSISGTSTFTFVYPDGAHNAESMFVDPLTKDIYIVTKEVNPGVYRAAYPQSTSGTTTLQQMTTFTDSSVLTATDISPDGNEIILRGYTTSGRMYVRPPGGTITDAFNSSYISIPIHSENQGEAIGFDPNGWGYFTTSEGTSQPIYYFDRLPSPGHAIYWDNDGAPAGSYVSSGAGTGGTGTWDSSSSKWYSGSADVAWVDGNDAVFWGAAGTVTLAVAQSVNSLTFKSNGYTLTASTLTLAGSSVTVDAGATATINSTVAGSVGLVKNGSGTLNLAHSNSYSGGTTINAGVLGIVSNALGTIPGSPVVNITINNGSTLRFNVSGLTVSINRNMVLGSGGGIIDTNGNADTIAGIISGTSMDKTGAGTLTLSNANTYTSGTTVTGGTLLVTNTSGSGTGTGFVTVNSGAVLGGTGTVSGIVSNGGTVAPGGSPGTLHVGGTYTQGSAGNLAIELASTASHDELVVTGAATLGGTISVSLLSGFVAHEDDSFEIMTASGFGGSTFTSTSLPALPGSLVWNINYGASAVTLSVVLPGDFTHSGDVNAADYVSWRKGVGTTYTSNDYITWRTHFSQTASAAASLSAAVPEPSTVFLSAIATLLLLSTIPQRHPASGPVYISPRR